MKLKPTTRSHNISDAELDDYATIILTTMRKNVSIFPNPHPDLDTFETLLTDFRAAVIKAAYRDKLAIIVRDEKRKLLQEAIRFLSFYVQTIARGDEATIVASGFIPSKPRNASEEIPLNLEDFQVIPTIGTSAIKLRIKAWRPARVYQFEYRKKENDSPWTVVLSSKSSCLISNLAVLEEYEFRVCYVGRTGKSPYSTIISSRVY